MMTPWIICKVQVVIKSRKLTFCFAANITTNILPVRAVHMRPCKYGAFQGDLLKIKNFWYLVSKRIIDLWVGIFNLNWIQGIIGLVNTKIGSMTYNQLLRLRIPSESLRNSFRYNIAALTIICMRALLKWFDSGKDCPVACPAWFFWRMMRF